LAALRLFLEQGGGEKKNRKSVFQIFPPLAIRRGRKKERVGGGEASRPLRRLRLFKKEERGISMHGSQYREKKGANPPLAIIASDNQRGDQIRAQGKDAA